MKERFKKKILTNLDKFKVTRAQLIEADNNQEKEDKRDKSSSRVPYTRSDDEAILKYILTHKEYSRVGSKMLWVEMEEKEVVAGRTWQSLKEHFKKKIMGNIRTFKFLTEEQRSSLKAKKLVTDKEKVTGMEEVGKVDKEEVDPVWNLEELELEGCEEEVAAEEGDEEEVEVSYILVDF